MITLLVNVIGLSLIGLIIWWFMIKKPKSIQITQNAIQIIVDEGVYEPAVLKARAGQALSLEFIRKDKSPCAEVVVFATLDINHELPINKPTVIAIKPLEPGVYTFSCQMGMYQGQLIIE